MRVENSTTEPKFSIVAIRPTSTLVQSTTSRYSHIQQSFGYNLLTTSNFQHFKPVARADNKKKTKNHQTFYLVRRNVPVEIFKILPSYFSTVCAQPSIRKYERSFACATRAFLNENLQFTQELATHSLLRALLQSRSTNAAQNSLHWTEFFFAPFYVREMTHCPRIWPIREDEMRSMKKEFPAMRTGLDWMRNRNALGRLDARAPCHAPDL